MSKSLANFSAPIQYNSGLAGQLYSPTSAYNSSSLSQAEYHDYAGERAGSLGYGVGRILNSTYDAIVTQSANLRQTASELWQKFSQFTQEIDEMLPSIIPGADASVAPSQALTLKQTTDFIDAEELYKQEIIVNIQKILKEKAKKILLFYDEELVPKDETERKKFDVKINEIAVRATNKIKTAILKAASRGIEYATMVENALILVDNIRIYDYKYTKEAIRREGLSPLIFGGFVLETNTVIFFGDFEKNFKDAEEYPTGVILHEFSHVAERKFDPSRTSYKYLLNYNEDEYRECYKEVLKLAQTCLDAFYQPAHKNLRQMLEYAEEFKDQSIYKSNNLGAARRTIGSDITRDVYVVDVNLSEITNNLFPSIHSNKKRELLFRGISELNPKTNQTNIKYVPIGFLPIDGSEEILPLSEEQKLLLKMMVPLSKIPHPDRLESQYPKTSKIYQLSEGFAYMQECFPAQFLKDNPQCKKAVMKPAKHAIRIASARPAVQLSGANSMQLAQAHEEKAREDL